MENVAGEQMFKGDFLYHLPKFCHIVCLSG